MSSGFAWPRLGALLYGAFVCCSACAARVRPPLLVQADNARQAPAVREAEGSAPQAYAEAELYRRQAEQAFASDDRAGADVHSEQALTAYQRAVVELRLARANARLADEHARLEKARVQVTELEAEQQRVLAEVLALELRVKVAEDALPLPTNTQSSPAREQARLAAARALATQAKLLCISARLLDPARASLSEALGRLSALGPKLNASPAPIDEATELRGTCLRELTLTRRPANQKNPGLGAADALLTELANANFLPFRDDRGVVVTLRSSFDAKDALTNQAAAALDTLAKTAKAHPDFPLLVIVHGESAVSSSRDATAANACARALRSAGAPRVEAELAGNALPVLQPTRPDARERNLRIEVVFVAPTSS
jgi:hypothetical protein